MWRVYIDSLTAVSVYFRVAGYNMWFPLSVALCCLSALTPGSCEPEEMPFVVRSGRSFIGRTNTTIIYVPNGGKFGIWMWPEMCPEEFYAVGFSIRVEPNQYGGDDTALNGIRLFCSRPSDRSYLYSVESHTGYFGDWSAPQWCPDSGFLKSFQLRVEPHQGIFGDDTSANNIKFRCSTNPTLEGQGMEWGEYGHWSQVCPSGGICGIQSKMELYQTGLDDSSLNDVRFHCCA